MNIAVHAKVLSERHFTGIGVYTYNILKALARIDRKNRYTLYSNEPLRHEIPGEHVSVKQLAFPRFWSYLRLPFEFVGGRYDLLFVPKEFVPPVIRPRTVIVVYDLGFFPEQKSRIALSGRIHFAVATRYAIGAADHVIAISESTKREIVATCRIPPERITAIPLGFDDAVYSPVKDPERRRLVTERLGISPPYFINTSSVFWERKNLAGLIRGFHDAKRRRGLPHKLVITGKRGTASSDIAALIETLGLASDVVITGFVETHDLPVLLSGADALVFPSLHEGFGLPLIEAMACGCPVVSSNCSAMPEVVGDAGLLVDPRDDAAIAEAFERLAGDPALREDLRRRGLARAAAFSWDRTARETLRVFETVAGAS